MYSYIEFMLGKLEQITSLLFKSDEIYLIKIQNYDHALDDNQIYSLGGICKSFIDIGPPSYVTQIKVRWDPSIFVFLLSKKIYDVFK